ncbi:MAG: methenyltetrahydromethanopterin cyclohydrolase [Chloroflexi bacterium]|nr:methenyltetrahydromethanopterin cyclohydrolase [Chloroflexota bacterium]MCL5075388.1 methenyltetrahydromethanopterin cyclohydrolase [Chloroflexota bacterium]
MLSINKEAMRIVRKVIAEADQLNVKVSCSPIGATIIDMGLNCDGGWLAGKYFVEIGLGGMGHVSFGNFTLGEVTLPSIDVWVDNPVIAAVVSQAGSWKLGEGELAPIGSGPARAIAKADQWARIGTYTDHNDEAIVQLQSDKMPEESTLRFVSESCGIAPENLYVLIAPTASLVGSIQVSARTVEQVMIKLQYAGFDATTIVHAFGTAPVAPVIPDEFQAMGRVNDCLIYGGSTIIYTRTSDEEIEKVIDLIPFSARAKGLYGVPFAQIFDMFHRNWFEVDPLLDSPAKVTINNLNSGRTFTAGEINYDVLRRSLLLVEDG